MQEHTTVARRYAEAAFEYAREHDAVAAWSERLQLLAAAVGTPELARLVDDPQVSDRQLTAILLDIGGERFDEPFRNFVRLLVEAGRVALAPHIAEQFERLRADAEGVVDVEVISAFPLGDEEQRLLAEAVERHFGRRVRLAARADAALIGGALVRVGDTVIDGSVRGRLQQVAAALD